MRLTDKQRAELLLLREDDNSRLRARATIIMACAEGAFEQRGLPGARNTTPATVARWRRAFCGDGCRGLRDAPRAGRPRVGVELSDDEREALLRYQRRATVSQSLAARARIVMLCAQGHTDTEVAKIVAMGADTVSRWRRRFAERRLQGLLDDERVGAPRKITDDVVEALVVATLESTPKGATHWSTRSMADKLGISNSSVGRIWRALGLKPHRSETFQLSTDPLFVEKVRDVVGLYMNPPDNAVVLCVDEKSQIQALNRTQPMLPLRPGQAARGTPEYQRNGTTTLFAALDKATGNVIGKCFARHRAVEFRKFLNEIRRNVPTTARCSHHRRQLRDAQRPDHQAVVGQQPEVPLPLHPHPLLLAQPSGRLVQHPDDQTDQARFAQKRRATEDGYRRVPRRMERKTPHRSNGLRAQTASWRTSRAPARLLYKPTANSQGTSLED